MIYLDIDGVMLAGQDYMADPIAFPAGRVTLLKQLLDYTNTNIVLSSTWRRSGAGRDIMSNAGLWPHMARYTANGKRCDWRTPFLTTTDDDDGFGLVRAQADPDLSIRGQEIQAHIDTHGIQRYIILDDDAVLAGQFYIAVNPHNGLTQTDIDRAIDLWNQQGN